MSRNVLAVLRPILKGKVMNMKTMAFALAAFLPLSASAELSVADYKTNCEAVASMVNKTLGGGRQSAPQTSLSGRCMSRRQA